MTTLPAAIVTLLFPFQHLFDRRTWRKAQLLVVGAILAPGKRTVSSALSILGIGQSGDFAIFHQVLNRARWEPLQLSRVLLLLVVGRLGASTEPLVFGIDETVERRWGRKIAAKGRYRDPVRSTDDQTVMTPGLQWVSLMLLTRIGWAGRHWALPFLTALVPSDRYDWLKGRRHKRFTDYAQQMLDCLRRWLPDRDLVVVCDGGYAKREFLLHCQRMSKPIVVITKLRKDASLYQPPPPRRPGQIGRPRVVGARLPSPTAVLDDPATQWMPYRATTSDGADLMVELTSGVALWYRGGFPSVQIRWVVVRHLEENPGAPGFAVHRHRRRPPADRAVVHAALAGRGDLRGTAGPPGCGNPAPVVRACHRRTTPTLFGLFSVVALAADVLIEQQGGLLPRTTAWYAKTNPTVADAIALVRRHIWAQQETFATSEPSPELIKLPRGIYRRMIETLAYAA